ncbi:MAG: mechanosensitive ion channel family protein [Bacteroidales bacterium]|nr:mechanosensitive ion channel family protein [Bacteroidales bacterium]
MKTSNPNFLAFLTKLDPVILLRAAIFLIVGVAVTLWLGKFIKKQVGKRYSPHVGLLASRFFIYTFLSLIIISFLKTLGFEVSALLGTAGVIGIAIGFASQTSVSNIISGLFLIGERPFELNDIVSVNDNTGVVISIDLLSIKLRTFDNRFVRIPNEMLIKTPFTNVTRFPIRRIDLKIGVAYKEDLKKVRAVLMEIAKNEPDCLNYPEPMAVFNDFGDSSLDLLFYVWSTKQNWVKVKNSLMDAIKERFDEEGIEIPFPHVSVYTGSVTGPMPVKIVEEDKK